MSPDTPTIEGAAVDAAAVRAELERQLSEREELIRDLAPRATPNDDPIAYMTSVSTQETVARIKAALQRVDEGTYGQCRRCTGPIAPARLEVLPYAETCIGCQSLVERA